MAERESQGWTDSPTEKATNEPSENPSSQHSQESEHDDYYTRSVVTGMQRMELQDNNVGCTAPDDGKELCQKKCLKILDMNSEVFITACNLLKIHQVQGRDWRGLAGRLGYTVTQVLIFETENNGVKYMLCDWNNDKNNYLEKLVKELREMKRDDVADLFQKEIDKKGESCNCPNCGHLV